MLDKLLYIASRGMDIETTLTFLLTTVKQTQANKLGHSSKIVDTVTHIQLQRNRHATCLATA